MIPDVQSIHELPVLHPVVYLLTMASTLFYATASLLQHHEARRQPAALSLHPALLKGLIRRPLWLLGTAADIAGFVAQAAALSRGSIIIVEAIKTSGIVVTLGLGALVGTRIRADQWPRITVVVFGLFVFLVLAHPDSGRRSPTILSWVAVTVVTVTVAGSGLRMARNHTGGPRSLGLGVATGAIWAVTAALLKQILNQNQTHRWALLTQPALWAFVAVALVGFVINQSAFQAGELVWSLPALTIVEPILASLYGIILFKETIHIGTIYRTFALIAGATAALIAAGSLALNLDRKPAHAD